MSRIVIGVMGAARASSRQLDHARLLGGLIAKAGWVLLTGGRDAGVMAAATAGAREIPGSLVVGVLPDSGSAVAEGVDVPIITGMGDARNAINVLSSRVVIACGVDGAGTASEVALAIKAGVPVILLDAEEDAVRLFTRLGRGAVWLASSPEEAVDRVRECLGT